MDSATLSKAAAIMTSHAVKPLRNYEIHEVQNGFVICRGSMYERQGSYIYGSLYLAKDMDEVGKILKRLQTDKEVE